MKSLKGTKTAENLMKSFAGECQARTRYTYFASKAFVLSYSRAIRYESKAKGVQVCTLCPGATKTNFFAREGTKTPRSAMTAEEVAAYAYKRLMKNKDIIIPGIANIIKNCIPMKLRIIFVAKLKKK